MKTLNSTLKNKIKKNIFILHHAHTAEIHTDAKANEDKLIEDYRYYYQQATRWQKL